jgi:hypothetical protein
MIFRIVVSGYVAMCFIVAVIRNPTLVLWVKNFIVDMLIAPIRLWAMLTAKPNPNAPGGSATISGGNGKGTGPGGDIVLAPGRSEKGESGRVHFNHLYVDGSGLRVMVDGKPRFIPLSES